LRLRREPSNEFLGRPYRYAGQRIKWVRTFLRNLGLASYLAFVAGVVNSVAFLSLGTFVSHISGHATRGAVEYSEGHFAFAATFFMATAIFFLGAITTTLCLRGQSIDHRTRRFALPVFFELALLAYVVVFAPQDLGANLGASLDSAFRFSGVQNASHGGSSFALETTYICIFSFAMGLQNALIRQASGTIVRTTHMTGVVTDMGIAMGTAFLSFFSETKLAMRHGWRPKLVVDTLLSFGRVFRYERFLLHFTVFFSFLNGAMIGTLGYQEYSYNVLYFPIFVLGFIIFREIAPTRRRKDNPPHERTPNDSSGDSIHDVAS
jgi:uncharacterized membrane protein YoaK (UPF0700 family)